MISNWVKALPAMFLVGGTAIGGGMLVLPLATGISGFIPSGIVMLLCWLAMTASGLFLLEASLWFEDEVHMLTMSRRLLGKVGAAFAWVLFLFISYASIVAYTASGGDMLEEGVHALAGISFGKALSCVLFFVIFGVVIDFGAQIVGRINALLFVGLVGAYVLIVLIGLPEVKTENLLHQRWSTALMSIPFMLTSFSYQTLVPSLTPYMKRNPALLRISVIGGTTIALLIYILWQIVVLGIVPAHGENGLIYALISGKPATSFIGYAADGKWIATVATFFGFFAIVTSFLGMGLGLFDFLADGLKVSKKGKGKLLLGSLIAFPTLFFAIFFERVFLVALDITGGFGDTILNGIMPVLMIWVGRYRLNLPSQNIFKGGKALLGAVLLFFVLSLTLEILIHLGLISSIYDVTEFNTL